MENSDLPKTRQDALDRGCLYYFTGKPCKYGHIAKRYTSIHRCVECVREYKANNPEYCKEKNAVYRDRNRTILREKGLAYYYNNIDACKERWQNWYANNKKKKREANRIWWQKNAQWNRERLRTRYQADPERFAQYQRQRRARKQNAEGHHSKEDVQKILLSQSNKCANCYSELVNYEIDHIMPLALGGSNWPCNIQILCPSCNKKKSAKDPFDWANENGKLI